MREEEVNVWTRVRYRSERTSKKKESIDGVKV